MHQHLPARIRILMTLLLLAGAAIYWLLRPATSNGILAASGTL